MNSQSPVLKDCSKPSSINKRPKEYTPNACKTFRSSKNFKEKLEKIVEETMISDMSSEKKPHKRSKTATNMHSPNSDKCFTQMSE